MERITREDFLVVTPAMEAAGFSTETDVPWYMNFTEMTFAGYKRYDALSFDELVEDHIVGRISGHMDKVPGDVSELVNELMDVDYINSWRAAARDTIEHFSTEAGETFEWAQDGGFLPNPFDEPQRFELAMFEHGVEKYLFEAISTNQLEEYLEKHAGEDLSTQEAVDGLLEALELEESQERSIVEER